MHAKCNTVLIMDGSSYITKPFLAFTKYSFLLYIASFKLFIK